MKKRALSIIFIISLILLVQLINAATNTSSGLTADTSNNENAKVEKAYSCLDKKIEGKCSSISTEEKIFSVLATGKCKTELIADSKSNECWPKSSCTVKSTAQAVLALSKLGEPTSSAEAWLLSKQKTPTELSWYLQIEAKNYTNCKISYRSSSYSVSINNDKKLSSGIGDCFSLAEGNIWLKISSGCYDETFEISCDQSFLTNLIYKKQDSNVYYVSDRTNSASASGKTTEKVNSLCFSKGTGCDYEGSLWATLVLKFRGQDVSAYMPYLITMAEDNPNYLPDAFLYSLGVENSRNNLLLKQTSGYWDVSGSKFYDTALALYPLYNEATQQKSSAIDWLLGVQDSSGCWQGIKETAFILFSVWPKTLSTDTSRDCETHDGYCMIDSDCTGKILSQYDCQGTLKCCDTQKELQICSDQSGEICNSNEECSGGKIVESSDLNSGENCCVGGGRCTEKQTLSACQQNNGVCRPTGCTNTEEIKSYGCDYSSDSCCVAKTSSGKSYLWVWILVILIIILVIAIILREKLKILWYRISSKKSSGTNSGRGPGGPYRPGPPGRGPPFSPVSQRIPIRPPMNAFNPRGSTRRIFPPSMGQPPRGKEPPRDELNDVLKKLKNMGK